MDRIHLDVLVAIVEFDTAGHAWKVLRRGHGIADRLRVLAAAANDVGDNQNLVERMRVDVRRLLIVFGFEGANEVPYELALVGGIELHDADIAKRRLARLLLKAERQPDRAELDRLPAATLRDAGLGECLGDAQPLALERVGWNHVHLAKTGAARCDRGEVVHVAATSSMAISSTARHLPQIRIVQK